MNEERNNPVLDRESYCNWISSVEDQACRNVLHIVLPRDVAENWFPPDNQDELTAHPSTPYEGSDAPMRHYFSATVPIVLLVSDDFRVWTPVDQERVEEIPGWPDWLKNQEVGARCRAASQRFRMAVRESSWRVSV